jgi:hypothetical protein
MFRNSLIDNIERSRAGVGALHRWLYRGGKPNWIAKAVNSLWAVVGALGITANYLVTLEVKGRTSGKLISLPVVMAWVDGQSYLVAMLGEHAQWVKNVRATEGRAVIRSGDREDVQLEEVPIDRRAPILKAYLQRAPGARPHVPIDKDAALAEFEKIAAEYPVFHIVSLKAVPR